MTPSDLPNIATIAEIALFIGFLIFITCTALSLKAGFFQVTGRSTYIQAALGITLIAILLIGHHLTWWTPDYSHIALAIFMAFSGIVRYTMISRHPAADSTNPSH